MLLGQRGIGPRFIVVCSVVHPVSLKPPSSPGRRPKHTVCLSIQARLVPA